jgi:hypothetical protein
MIDVDQCAPTVSQYSAGCDAASIRKPLARCSTSTFMETLVLENDNG